MLPTDERVAATSAPGLRSAARFGTVLGIFTLATVAIFWPWIAHLGGVLIGPPEDNMQDMWNTWYAAMGRDPRHFFFTNLLRFPEGTSLVYQSFAYPQVLAAAALSAVFGHDVRTLVTLQNVTLLASFPLAGVGGFYLVRHFAQSTAGGLVGGFVFAFNPSHVAQVMHHAHVSSIEFLPVFVFAYLIALERKSYAWLAVAIAFFALSALSCWYYLFYGAYFLLFHALYLRLRDRAWPRGWNLKAPALCLAATGVLLLPVVIPMVLVARPSAYDGGGNLYVIDLLGYVLFPPTHLLAAASRPIFRTLSGNPWEATAYLGLVNLLALAWLCVTLGVKRASSAFYVLSGMIFFAILACGEELHVAGRATFIHLPDIVLDHLPFAANVRTPSRAIAFTYLFLSMGVGLAAATALERWQGAWRLCAAASVVLIVLDFWPQNLASTPISCPTALSAIARDPEHGFGVLNLPISKGNSAFAYMEGDADMLEQVCHGRPIVDGNTTRQMGRTLLNRLLETKDLESQGRQLRAAHVKYIVMHRRAAFEWGTDLPPAKAYPEWFRTVYDGPDLAILRVY